MLEKRRSDRLAELTLAVLADETQERRNLAAALFTAQYALLRQR
jgi:hypothetical protein